MHLMADGRTRRRRARKTLLVAIRQSERAHTRTERQVARGANEVGQVGCDAVVDGSGWRRCAAKSTETLEMGTDA